MCGKQNTKDVELSKQKSYILTSAKHPDTFKNAKFKRIMGYTMLSHISNTFLCTSNFIKKKQTSEMLVIMSSNLYDLDLENRINSPVYLFTTPWKFHTYPPCTK